MSNVYDFTANSLDGKPVSLRDYAGKVLLIVNTASKCGFTPQYEGLEALHPASKCGFTPQYEGLEALHQKYQDRGFAVLGFPCNQFGAQEPGSAAEIGSFCQKNYGVSFPMFEKIDVNGEGAHPLYRWLKSSAKGLLGSEGIKWNFTKFLVDRNGNVIDRFAPTTKPEDLKSNVEALL